MIQVPTTVHGRVLVEPDEVVEASSSAPVLVGFHGYAQTAEDMMAELRQIPGTDGWTKISIQALNRFYIRGNGRIVSSWMTREDRELAIADNIAYVNNVLDTVLGDGSLRTLVFAGFSQGVAMAYRAALCGNRPAAAIIGLAGDIPPELQGDQPLAQAWPRVLIGVGDKEEWYSAEKIAGDLAFLSSRGIEHLISRFDGGHEWTDAFRSTAAEFLRT